MLTRIYDFSTQVFLNNVVLVHMPIIPNSQTSYAYTYKRLSNRGRYATINLDKQVYTMKTKAEEKSVHTEQKSCSNPEITSREQVVTLRKTGEALIELAEELQKVDAYDQQNPDINHATEDRDDNGLKVIFYQQAERLLNDKINALRRIQTKLRKIVKQYKKKP